MKQESGGVGTGEQLYCCEHESNHGTSKRMQAAESPTAKMERQDGRSPLQSREGMSYSKRMNQEAGDASEDLVSCSVQICAAHTPQTFLEIRGLQSGFGPDQVCVCCSFGVVIQLGPTNAACPTSTNPPPMSVKYPR